MTTAPNFSLSVLEKKIAFSTLVQYAGKALELLLAAISIKMISNFLSQEGYGVYAAITEYALFFSTIANLGIFGNVVRLMADRPKDGQLFLNSLVLRIISGLLFFSLAVLITFFMGNGGVAGGSESVFAFGTLIFCGALFFDFVTSVCDGMLQANYLMGRATVALTVGRIVNIVLLWLLINHFALSGFGSSFWQFLVLGATLTGSLVTCILSLIFVAKKIQINWNIDWVKMFHIFKVSLPFGIINVVNNLYFRFLPDYFSHQMLDDRHFASFNILFRISQVLSLASTFLMFSALPGLTEYIDQGHRDKAQKLYQILRKILLGGGVALVVVGSLIGPTVVTLLTHSKYNLPEFWFVLPLMLVLCAISYGYDLVLLTLFAAGEDLWFMKLEFLALFMALLFFGGSLYVSDMTVKMILILTGAIAGEAIMVLFGSLKIQKIWKQKTLGRGFIKKY